MNRKGEYDLVRQQGRGGILDRGHHVSKPGSMKTGEGEGRKGAQRSMEALLPLYLAQSCEGGKRASSAIPIMAHTPTVLTLHRAPPRALHISTHFFFLLLQLIKRNNARLPGSCPDSTESSVFLASPNDGILHNHAAILKPRN